MNKPGTRNPTAEERARIQRVLAKLSPGTRERVALTPALVAMEADRRKKHFPSKDYTPNIGQQRFFEHYRKPDKEYGDYPHIGIFRGANGVGKTCTLAIMLAGIALGPEFVNPEHLDLEFFYFTQEIRARETLHIRIVCDGVDVTESGSVYQQIKKWIPTAEFGGKQGTYYTTITIPAPLHGFNKTVVDVKTHGQEVVAHAGPDLHVIMFNEPCPEKHWGENTGRLRMGGRVMCFLTPMNASAYLHKIEIDPERPRGEVVVVEASIWDNCADIPGTRGILAKTQIEKLIRGWRLLNPLELPARRDGKYMHLAGAVFQMFSEERHVIPPMAIDPSWNIYLIVDPHPVKPPFAIWVAVTPLNFHYVIAEYPVEPWDQITTTHYSIKQHAYEFRRIEAGKHEQFSYIRHLRPHVELGDPNKFKERLPNSGRTYKQEYELSGINITTAGVSDDLQVGHDRIRELIIYDQERPIGPLNCPRLFVFNSCKNVRRALAAYAYKTRLGEGSALSENIDPTWACPIACLRYHATAAEPWQQSYAGSDIAGFDEQDEIDRGRSAFSEERAESFDMFDEEGVEQVAYHGERIA